MTARGGFQPASSLALLLLLACSDNVAPKGTVQHVVPVAGGGQSGATLDTLPEWLVVRVVNDGGEPLAGVPVTWSSDDETGRVVPVDPVTRGDGIARGIAVLGFTDGAQRFRAHAEGFDDVATFDLTAVRGPVLEAVSLMNASASDHMCALDADGRAWCWGQNYSGQLGNGTTERSDVARPVQTTQRFRSIVGSSGTTCAIALDYTLWCWGANQGWFGDDSGLFGNGTTQGSLVPVPAAAGLSVVDVDIDLSLACAVTTVGEAWCWGRIIGPDGGVNTLLPVKVESSERWRDISVSGSDRVCAIALDYEVHCWADGATSAQYAGIEGNFRSPQPVSGIPPSLEISVSWWNQCALLASGASAVCWGTYLNGVASLDPIHYPRVGRSGIARVRARAQTAMALGTDGALYIWGQPPQCCDGYLSATPLPLEPSGPWLDFAISEFGVFGILAADSTVHYWYPFPGFGPVAGVVPHAVARAE